MSDLRKLWQLQMLEEQQEKFNQGADPGAVNQLKEKKKQIEMSQNSLRELKERYQKAKVQAANLERRGQELRDECKLINAKIYDGSLQIKEIQNYQQKLQKLQKELSLLEDRELEMMQAKEDIKKEWEGQKKKLEDLSEEFKELHSLYLHDKEETKTRAEGMAREINTLLQEIGEASVNQYRQLKTRHRNPVGRVVKDSCSGCHLGIPFEIIKQLKNQDAIVLCNHCGRMLFWDPF
ncbi:MAG: zinc ribbon domain-containing protein [Bacillota bacterium]